MGGTGTVVATISLAEEAEKEEALNEKLEDLAFTPSPPVAGVVAAWSNGATYALGALVQEHGIVYRSQEAENKAHEPKADADFAHWAPVGISSYPLQNANFVTYDKVGTLQTRFQIVGVSIDPGQQVYAYDKAREYHTGECAVEGATGYEALATTTNEAPSTHALAWKAIGPAISLGV